MKDGYTVTQAVEGHSYKIECGKDNQRISQKEGIDMLGSGAGSAHGIFDGEIGQSIAQRQTAGVAHEGFSEFLLTALHIVEEKDNDAAHKGCDENDIVGVMMQAEQESEYA